MAQIIWKPRAIRQLNAIIDYSVPEFGMVAFKRMTIEPLLKNDKVVFRYCTLRKRHKLIYHYSAVKDTVYIDDIWDMKMNPKTLRKRFE